MNALLWTTDVADIIIVITLLFIAYSFVAMSLATNVVKTVARYASFTSRYSSADLCQYKYLHELAATIDTCERHVNFQKRPFSIERNRRTTDEAFTLNLSSTEARELSNSGESRNSQGRIGCRKFESLRTFTLPLSSSANLSVRVRFCIAYASPACKDIIDANSGDTSLLNCNRDTCFVERGNISLCIQSQINRCFL